MQNSVALVTGSSRGIGRATAIKLASLGYAVCINYRTNRQAAEDVLQHIKTLGAPAIAVQADVSEESQVENLFNTIDAELGTINALVNNAGILMQQSNLLGLNAKRIDALFHNNVTSYFLCCREAVRRMLRYSVTGVIVNVSSGAARTGSPNEYIDYAATKGAIDTLTVGLAHEVASEGIRVVGVRPGFIDTTMHADGGEPDRIERVKQHIPLGRGGKPEEVANTIAWLLSDEASFITGSIIDVTGGR